MTDVKSMMSGYVSDGIYVDGQFPNTKTKTILWKLMAIAFKMLVTYMDQICHGKCTLTKYKMSGRLVWDTHVSESFYDK